MNRFFNEGVSSSVSRVSGLSGGVGQKCRQSCDIPNSASPSANRRPHNETAIKISFNGIFESNPRSEGSVASDRSESPVVSPMVALNHNRQSPTPVDNDGLTDNHQMEDNRVNRKRGRKRKVKEVLDPLKEKFETRLRVQKSATTEELVQKFNIEVKDSPELGNNKIVTTIRTNKRHKNVSNVDIDVNETESKSELMQRFLSSQSSNTSPAIQEDNDFSYNSHSGGYGDQPVTSPQSVSHSSGHCLHPNVSLEQTSYPLPQTSYHQKTVSSDSVGDEINNILSHLPPLRVNDIVWSDSEPNDDKSSDNELNSEPNDDIKDHNKDHNHNRDQQNSDLESNNSSDNISTNLRDSHRDSHRETHKESNESNQTKTVTEYEVEKYCEQKWESVNGTYDAETEWRPWNSMTSAVSYNSDTLHILPYVDIDLRFDQNSDSE